MKRDLWYSTCAVLTLSVFLGVPGNARAEGADQPFGSVVGKVRGPQGNPLPGASVALAGTNLRAITDVSGTYRLFPVPTGEHHLTISYLGSQDVTVPVAVQGGKIVAREVTLEVFGDEVTVLADPILGGQAKALNQQKNALNITNVVAADQIGRFPDPNAAEATQRIPGITLLRDQGEGRFVLVRGTESRLNSMTINGERIPSPNGGGRDIALDVIPADLLEAIEVTKTLTPDMDGDAIGGTVNLVTKRAPERVRIAATLAGGRNEITDDGITAGNVTYGRRLGADRALGVLLSGSALETDRGSDNFETEYDDGFLDELQLRDYTIERQRYGGTGSLDYSPSDKSEYFLQGIWNEFNDTEIRRRKRERPGDDAIERDIKERFEAQRIVSARAGASHLIGSSLLAAYRLGWSYAREDEPVRIDSTFIQEDVEFAPNVSPDFIAPDDIRANPVNEDLGAFFLDELAREDNRTEEQDLVAALDISRPFYRHEDFSGIWKAGVKARFKHKERDSNVLELDVDDLALVDLLDDWRSETPFFGGRYDIGPFHSPGLIRELSVRLEAERDFEADLEDYEADEDTTAAYALVEIYRGELTVLGGLRYEHTETSFQAFELADGDEFLTPVAEADSYDELLPMIHLRYRLDEASNLRAAITRTLARPNFEDLAPFLFEEDEERSRGNPALDVTTAWNADLLYERYFEPVGVFSAGIFYKHLTDNIFTFTFEELSDGVTFDVTQPRNGSSADLVGFEVALQNRLKMLPHPFDGLGIYFNYTYSDSEVGFPDRAATRLQGQAEHVGNFALSYEKGGFSGRLSLSHQSRYLLEVGEAPEEDVVVDDHFQVDFSATQRITDRLRIFLELINLNDEPFRVYEGSPDRPIQEEVYSWWGTIGLKWDF